MARTKAQQADDINTLSTFLANSQISDLHSLDKSIDVIVSCVSSVLFPTTALFQHLRSNPRLTRSLLLCGGKGHSTPHIYAAIKSHPLYSRIYDEIVNLPESHVLLMVLDTFFEGKSLRDAGLQVFVEDKSTNCGANAVETKRVLESVGIISPKTIVLYQDCTMSLRTKAGFDCVYEGTGTEILCWPGWMPIVKAAGDHEKEDKEVIFDVARISKEAGRVVEEGELWSMQRFLGLIVGEIPRFEAYGPRGSRSVVDVQIPERVRSAWERLKEDGVNHGR